MSDFEHQLDRIVAPLGRISPATRGSGRPVARRHAILGLALSGRPEAAQTLRSLQQPGGTDAARSFQAQIGDLVSEALNEYQKMSSQGLADYDRTNRR